MMYEMFGELLLNNVLFALKRVDNLPADMHLAFKRKQLFGVYSNNCFCTFEFLISHALGVGIVNRRYRLLSFESRM